MPELHMAATLTKIKAKTGDHSAGVGLGLRFVALFHSRSPTGLPKVASVITMSVS